MNRNYRLNKRDMAFTLMEVMISFSILLMMMTALFGMQRLIFANYTSGMWQNEAKQSLKLFLNRLNLDLSQVAYYSEVDSTGIISPDYYNSANTPPFTQKVRYLAYSDAVKKRSTIDKSVPDGQEILNYLIQSVKIGGIQKTKIRVIFEKATVEGSCAIRMKRDNKADGSFEVSKIILKDIDEMVISHTDKPGNYPNGGTQAQYGYLDTGTIQFEIRLKSKRSTAFEIFSIRTNVQITPTL